MEIELSQLVDHSEPEVYESIPKGEELTETLEGDKVLQINLIIPLLVQYRINIF